jgi:MFS family permease
MAMFGIGSALGPAVFGLLVDRVGWSAVFSFRVPVAAAAFLLAWTLPRPAPGARETFDAAGGALLAMGLGFALLALNRLRPAGAETVLFALIAAAGFVLFHGQEKRARNPVIDVGYFRQAGFASINLCNALVNLSAFSIMLLAPFYLASVPGLSLPWAGLVLASSPAAMILAAPLAGRLASGISSRSVATAGLACSGAGLFLVSVSGSVPVMAASMAVQGFGAGLFQVAYLDIVTAAIPARNRGVAGALGMATRSVGTVTGATVLMLLFQALRTADPGSFLPAFQATFRVAAAIPLALVPLVAMRPRNR